MLPDQLAARERMATRLAADPFVIALKVRRGWLVEQMIERLEGNLLCPWAKA